MLSKKKKKKKRLDGQEIIKSKSFRYLGSIIHKDGEIDKDVIIG